MSLMKCAECGGMVSSSARWCPHCGAPQKETLTNVPAPSDDVLDGDFDDTEVVPVTYERMSSRWDRPVQQRQKPGLSGWAKVILAVIVALLVFLFVTCPDRKRHELVLRDNVSMAVEEMRDSLGISGGLASVGQMLVDQVTRAYLGSQFSVDNYLVCSVGKIHFNYRSVVISFGICHHVFCFIDKDFIRDEMQRWQQRKKDDVKSFFSILKNMFGFGPGDDDKDDETSPSDMDR